ncbi:MAG: hypothetical protein HYX47_01090 [Burkholderiales bacterium]|nr:hypothetical protein [Burkholderiales bacterium]
MKRQDMLYAGALAASLVGMHAAAQTPYDGGSAQVYCQGAFNKGDFAGLDRVYRSYMAETRPALRRLSEECMEAISVFVPSGAPESAWTAMEKKADTWAKQTPASLLARLVHAKVILLRATMADNAGASWAAVDNELDRASRILDAQPTASRDSNWYVKKLEIAKRRESPSGTVVELMNGALSVDPVALAPYEAAIRALDTQRGRGDPQLVEWLATTAAEKTRATEGMARYARIYEQAAVSFYQLRMNPFGPGRADWLKLDQGFRDLEKHSPIDYRINVHAGFACLARDKKTTSELLARIGTKVDRTAWYLGPGPNWAMGRHYDECKTWAAQGERAT